MKLYFLSKKYNLNFAKCTFMQFNYFRAFQIFRGYPL